MPSPTKLHGRGRWNTTTDRRRQRGSLPTVVSAPGHGTSV